MPCSASWSRTASSFTMDAVARRASCSKETLYKWFGDRDGLLTATVRWQASRVHAGHDAAQVLDGATLRERLQDFAVTWLEVITGPTSVALNRIAIAHAGSRKSNLGGIVLANGRFAIGERVKPVLEAGRAAGLLTFADSEAAFRTFLGLVGRDIQIRLLLGETLRPRRGRDPARCGPRRRAVPRPSTAGPNPTRNTKLKRRQTCGCITIATPT